MDDIRSRIGMPKIVLPGNVGEPFHFPELKIDSGDNDTKMFVEQYLNELKLYFKARTELIKQGKSTKVLDDEYFNKLFACPDLKTHSAKEKTAEEDDIKMFIEQYLNELKSYSDARTKLKQLGKSTEDLDDDNFKKIAELLTDINRWQEYLKETEKAEKTGGTNPAPPAQTEYDDAYRKFLKTLKRK